MAVKIRLRRMGARSKPFYRLVVADSRSPRDGRFIEMVGYYDPRAEPPVINVNAEKVLLWLNRGAQPTDTAAVLLKKVGISHKALGNKERTKEEPESPAKPAAGELKAEVASEATRETVVEAEPAVETEAATESKTRSTRKKKASLEDEGAEAETASSATETETIGNAEAADEKETTG
ncbi:MAG: 30S ribosomal protein S16 [Armatimonadetes bacterium]|nr:30S ribosomal protein S16 [Armatimonadota bacterium]